MFDPNTLLIESSKSPFFALIIETAASGIDVAAAIIVKEIIIGCIPIAPANNIACSVKKYVASPIIIIDPNPMSMFLPSFISFFFAFFIPLAVAVGAKNNSLFLSISLCSFVSLIISLTYHK